MAFMAYPTTRPRKSLQDYLALPDDVRAELIDGELYMTPAPRPVHQRVGFRLGRAVARLVEGAELGEVFVAPVDVHLPTGDIVQPDIVWIAADQMEILKDDGVHGVPRLCVEVLSPSHPERDRLVKRDRYARSGVPEYWIVDPDSGEIEVFVLTNGRYEPAGWFRGDATLRSQVLPGLALEIEPLFRRPAVKKPGPPDAS